MPEIKECLSVREDYEGRRWLCVQSSITNDQLSNQKPDNQPVTQPLIIDNCSLMIEKREVFEVDKLYTPEQIRGRLRYAGLAESLCQKLIAEGIFVHYCTDSWGEWYCVQLSILNDQLSGKKVDNQLDSYKDEKKFFRNFLSKQLKQTTI
jgi:hypothetical protein